MMTQELQIQAGIIQGKILGVAGALKLCTMTNQPPPKTLRDELGEALLALQDMMTEIAKEPSSEGT